MASSLEFNATTDRAIVTMANSSATFTVSGWVKPAANSSSVRIVVQAGGGSQSRGFFYDSVNGFQAHVNLSPKAQDFSFAANPGFWHYVAVVVASYNFKGYIWAEGDSSPTTLHSDNEAGQVSLGLDYLNIGGPDGSWPTAFGEYRWWRAWTGVALDTTKLGQEKNSATVVNATGCIGAWALPDATTVTDSSGAGNHLTITSGGTGATEPTLAAAASIAPLAMSHFRRLRA